MIEPGTRYLQIAFNDDLGSAMRILATLPKDPRILIEAGTPFIKREGMKGIRRLRLLWRHGIVADLKTTDGGGEEVEMVQQAGATAATVMGSSPVETLERFIAECQSRSMDAIIDMLGVDDPLRVLRRLRTRPASVVIGRAHV